MTSFVRQWSLVFVCLASAAGAQRPPVIALLPLDSRPVCTQMPQMLGQIAGTQVLLPPANYLGKFTQYGNCDQLSAWLRSAASKADALVISADMLCYGGLVASRDPRTPEDTALARLAVLEDIRKQWPNKPIFLFSGIMRTAPTATLHAAKWRLSLADYMMYKDRLAATGDRAYAKRARTAQRRVPKKELRRYEATRERDHAVQIKLIVLLKRGTVDYLVLGQDDAEAYGPHRAERVILSSALQQAGIAGKAMICGGIDQTASILVARALAKGEQRSPRVWVEWASPAGRHVVPPMEGQTVDKAVWAQVYSVGARPAESNEAADIVLFVNTPKRSASEFTRFKEMFTDQVESGKLVGVADLNLSAGGKADGDLLRYLLESRVGVNLASYAGWNTASNTLGTAIPQAISYWLARQDATMDARQREIAQREFLLLRFASEYGYHNYIRPLAYEYLVKDLRGDKEEAVGGTFSKLESFVSKNATKMLTSFFDIGFRGAKFPVAADGAEETIAELTDVRIGLPWPRAYEVEMSFSFVTRPANTKIRREDVETSRY